jgi:hypothetical protein
MSAVTSGTRNYWKSAFVKGLPDGAIDVITEHGKGLEQSPMSGLLVEYCGGAGGRKPIDENAFAQREPDYCIGFMPQWMDAKQDDQHIRGPPLLVDTGTRGRGPARSPPC